MKTVKNIIIGLTLTLMTAAILLAQEEKITPRIDLSYNQSGDDVPFILIKVRKKVERKFLPMPLIPVSVYFNEESDEMEMGRVVTNHKGEGKVELPDHLKSLWNKSDEHEFISIIASSDTVEETSESVTIMRARLRITGERSEEAKIIKAVLEQRNGDDWIAVPETEIKVFVERHFGKLFISEDAYTSDEAGAIEAEFTGEIPGDSIGNIEMGVMIEDHDEFGNVFAYTTVPWGLPLIDDNTKFDKRSLWSTRNKTPLWLLIFPNLIIAGVWGVIGYLLIQIFKIKKLSKLS